MVEFFLSLNFLVHRGGNEVDAVSPLLLLSCHHADFSYGTREEEMGKVVS